MQRATRRNAVMFQRVARKASTSILRCAGRFRSIAALFAALAAFFVALIGGWITRPGTPRRGFALSLAGIVMGAAAFGVPFAMLQIAQRVPPIHDITTDTVHPPQFVARLYSPQELTRAREMSYDALADEALSVKYQA